VDKQTIQALKTERTRLINKLEFGLFTDETDVFHARLRLENLNIVINDGNEEEKPERSEKTRS